MGEREEQLTKRVPAEHYVELAEEQLCNYRTQWWGEEWCDAYSAVGHLHYAQVNEGAPDEYREALKNLEERVFRVAEELRESLRRDAVTPEAVGGAVRELEGVLSELGRLNAIAEKIADEESRWKAADDLDAASFRVEYALDKLRRALDELT